MSMLSPQAQGDARDWHSAWLSADYCRPFIAPNTSSTPQSVTKYLDPPTFTPSTVRRIQLVGPTAGLLWGVGKRHYILSNSQGLVSYHQHARAEICYIEQSLLSRLFSILAYHRFHPFIASIRLLFSLVLPEDTGTYYSISSLYLGVFSAWIAQCTHQIGRAHV